MYDTKQYQKPLTLDDFKKVPAIRDIKQESIHGVLPKEWVKTPASELYDFYKNLMLESTGLYYSYDPEGVLCYEGDSDIEHPCFDVHERDKYFCLTIL